MTTVINYHLNHLLRESLPQRRVRHDLEQLSRAQGIKAIHVYPDLLQDEPGMPVPVGVSIETDGPDPLIYPCAVTDSNDGYRLIHLKLKAQQLRHHDQDALKALDQLREPWSALQNINPDIILTEGIEALRHLKMPLLAGEPDRISERGRVDISNLRNLHILARQALQEHAGQFGSYGHFLEIMTVQRDLPEHQLEHDDLLLVIHGGAMQASEHVFWNAYFEFARLCGATDYDHDMLYNGLTALPYSHSAARAFWDSSQMMVNAGFFWRAALHRRILSALQHALEQEIQSRVLSDIPHNRLERTNNGFLHAKGVQKLQQPWPMIICGDLGGRSSLIQPLDPENSAFGCCHGRARHPRLSAIHTEPLPTPLTNQPHKLPTPLQYRLLEQNHHHAIESMTQSGAVRLLSPLLPVLNFRGDPKMQVKIDGNQYKSNLDLTPVSN